MKITKLIGLSASAGSMILWFIFTFYNPYTHERVDNDVLINTLFTLFAPACVALLGSVIKNPSSLYTAMTPSIFILFGMTSVLYLVSGILFIRDKSHRNKVL
ncbi:MULTISPECIES: hypothetical protein [unclassified Paenibacillus]|uniref:hypothetical protein n=1 Tax=unclassified Paenibacillus TaxID=185978 RepID=UPI0036404414